MADASSSSSAPPPVTRILSLCSSIYQQLHHHNRYHYRNHHYQQQQQQQQGKLWSSALRVARWLWGVSSPLLRVGRFHGLAFSCTFACAWMALQLVIFEILDGPYRRSNPPDFRRVRAMCSLLCVRFSIPPSPSSTPSSVASVASLVAAAHLEPRATPTNLRPHRGRALEPRRRRAQRIHAPAPAARHRLRGRWRGRGGQPRRRGRGRGDDGEQERGIAVAQGPAPRALVELERPRQPHAPAQR